MSNAKIRHRRHRRAKRSAHIQPTEYTSARDLDWCFEDTFAGRASRTERIATVVRGGRLHTLLALAALATIGGRF